MYNGIFQNRCSGLNHIEKNSQVLLQNDELVGEKNHENDNN